MKKHMPEQNSLRNFLLNTVGSIVYGLSFVFFLSPCSINTGGAVGIAMTINVLTGLPLGVGSILVNVPIIVVAFFKLGGKVLISTVFAVLLSSAVTDIGAIYLPPFTDDILLAAIYGGLLQGVGLALIFMSSATVGGNTLLNRILRCYFPNMKAGKMQLILDACVITFGAMALHNLNLAMYSVICLYVSSTVMDLILYGRGQTVMVYIISNKPDELRDAMQEHLQRNITYLSGEGGYSGEDKRVIFCVMHKSEYAGLSKIIQYVDPSAFVTVSDTKEVFGGGFKAA